ncbi:MAG: hypothetical protein JXA42_16295 [Anaerolineales bacterium]|nr:hypothetical protein [Anaerolineales bacterium]
MSGRTLQDIQDERQAKRKGLTGRGIVGCFTLLASLGIAYGLYWWLSKNYPLRTMLGVSKSTLPDPFFEIFVIIILFVIFQATLTLLGALMWRLRGKDQKVKDKLDELYEHWDEIQF